MNIKDMKASDFQNEIYKTIDIIVEERLKSLSFNYCVDGVVKSNKDNNGLYKVLINGEMYDIKARVETDAYTIGDVVSIVVENSDFNKRKYISRKK